MLLLLSLILIIDLIDATIQPSIFPLKPLPETGITITSLSVSHGNNGPWHWSPTVPDKLDIACTLNFNGVINYRKHSEFNTGGTGTLESIKKNPISY